MFLTACQTPGGTDYHRGPLRSQAEIDRLTVSGGVGAAVVERDQNPAEAAEKAVGGNRVNVPARRVSGVEGTLKDLAGRQVVEVPVGAPRLGQVAVGGEDARDLTGDHALQVGCGTSETSPASPARDPSRPECSSYAE